jgi:very-short-patch-repair endonuclease
VYPEHEIVIEGHSKLWHSGVEAQSRDARRDASIRALGYLVIYATWADATRYRDRFTMGIGRLLDSRDPARRERLLS